MCSAGFNFCGKKSNCVNTHRWQKELVYNSTSSFDYELIPHLHILDIRVEHITYAQVTMENTHISTHLFTYFVSHSDEQMLICCIQPLVLEYNSTRVQGWVWCILCSCIDKKVHFILLVSNYAIIHNTTTNNVYNGIQKLNYVRSVLSKMSGSSDTKNYQNKSDN